MNKKLIDFNQARGFFESLRQSGKTIVQCHGTFDLIHPGHIVHFQEARRHGDVLVVTITAEKFVNKGPGRPYFNDEFRALSLVALTCVDYVVIIPHVAAVEAIECVRPHVYCKGTEYNDQSNDVTGNIANDVETVKRFGGRMEYVGSVTFSSTQLINQHLSGKSETLKSFLKKLAEDYPPDAFRESVESLSDLNILVIGDVIIDRYTTVAVQGLTSKNRVISTRFINDELQVGGSLAVYRHIREFVGKIKLLSIVGTEPWVDGFLSQHLPQESDALLRDANFTTIVKQRFVEPANEGKELSKLFSINYLDKYEESPSRDARIIETLSKTIHEYDAVVVMDFGHGLLGEKLRDFLQDKAKFFVLNCQTNSNNYGFNIIDKRYRRANAFCVDEKEMQLACGNRLMEPEYEFRKLKQKLDTQYAWLTRGSASSFAIGKNEQIIQCEAFEKNVLDTVGAGDAFLSLCSLFAIKNYPTDLTLFAGQLAGAHAVKIIGNRDHIHKANILKSGMSLLKF